MCSILPETSDVSIDNTDSAWITYRPAEVWKRFVDEKFKSSSQHQTQAGGASFTVKFNGSYVWYVSDKNFDHGRFQVELDGNVSTGTSYWTSYQAEEYLFCQELDGTQEHTLTVSNLDDGKYFTIDYITYRPVASSPSSSESLPSTASSPTAIASDSTSLSAQSTATGSRGMNPGIYVGIILFAVALVLLGLLFFFVRRDRRRRAQRQQTMPPPPETVESGHWMQWQWPAQSSQSSLVSWHEPRRGSS